MKALNAFLLLSILMFIISCGTDDDTGASQMSVTGFVQKGPYTNGASVTLFELNSSLAQTGKSFSAQISGNSGQFELKNVALVSKLVLLKADGFYFNENLGENSQSTLTLYAICDLTERTSANVNILSHLEKTRIEFLVSKGKTFKEAKVTAQQDILKAFNLEGANFGESEALTISQLGEGNARLLAISSILQGFRNVADLSELLNAVASDIKEDGKIDSPDLQSKLVSHANYLNPVQVKDNLSNKYKELGTTASIPEFSNFLNQFLTATAFKLSSLFNYPEHSALGLNILNEKNTTFSTGNQTNYSVSAITSKGLSLKVELQVIEGTVAMASWGIRSDYTNWKVGIYNLSERKQLFEVVNPGQLSDLKILFPEKGLKIRVKLIEGQKERIKVISII